MKRLVVVDDSLTVRMDLVELFQEQGYDAVGCRDLASARVALTQPADLVVLDLQLPDGDGLDLLEELRQRPVSPPVVLLTQEREVRDRLGAATPDAFLGKPYDTDHVLDTVRKLLARRRERPVLVVDDSATWRNMLADRLQAQGYGVTTASDGRSALQMAAADPPLALLIDGQMPGMDGHEVVRRLRLDPALQALPCLMVTAEESGIAELKALECGSDAYVRKESGVDIVLMRLKAMLQGRTHLPQLAPGPTARHVLAVDDSLTYLAALERELVDHDYRVTTARSGEEALELLETMVPDAILMDMMMPGMSGSDACRLIKAERRLADVPLLILTAMEERQAMVEGINAGADDYVPKSADFEVLRARLVAQLRRRQVEQQHRQLREQLVRREMEAAESRAAAELARTRATLLEQLEAKNAALEQARDLAQRQSEYKSAFLANMSHELRTPLNAIIGFSELMQGQLVGPLNEQQLDFITHVVDAGRHLLSLINDILDLTKVEAGRIELKRSRQSVVDIAASAIEVIRPLADKRKVTLDTDFPEGLPEAHVDGRRVKQILYNLLSNAVKFTREGSTVTCGCRARGDRVLVDVIDQGPGIADEDLPRLFQEFEQIEPREGGRPEGTGLGLALSRRLARLHGGDIEVDAEVGKGCRFTLVLRSVVPLAEPGLEPPTVLVVEDDESTREMLTATLRRAGVEVRAVQSAAEALAVVNAISLDLVMLDLVLPDRSGWELLAEIRAANRDEGLPVVVVTGLDQPSRGLLGGATDYLRKPVTPEQVLASVRLHGVSTVELTEMISVDADPRLDRLAAELADLGVPVTRGHTALDIGFEATPGQPGVVMDGVTQGPHVGVPLGSRVEVVIRAAALARGGA